MSEEKESQTDTQTPQQPVEDNGVPVPTEPAETQVDNPTPVEDPTKVTDPTVIN